MRLLLAAAVVLAAVPPLRAAPQSDPMNWLCGPAAPQCFAYDLDDRGLARYPYDALDDYQSGATWQSWTRVARQFTEGSREATHVVTGLRLDGRLGGEFELSRFQAGAFHSSRRPTLASLRSTADLSAGDDLTLEYGFGFSALWADRTYAGPSLSFSAEKRLGAPFVGYARWQPAVLAHMSLLQDLSAGVSANWRWLGLDAGYRVLFNSLRNEYGPELALRLWF